MSAVIDIPTTTDLASGRRRRLAVATTGTADVLVRALTVLRRRGCRIVAVDFHEADRHGPGRFELAIDAPPRTADRLESWLLGLVDVLDVRASQ